MWNSFKGKKQKPKQRLPDNVVSITSAPSLQPKEPEWYTYDVSLEVFTLGGNGEVRANSPEEAKEMLISRIEEGLQQFGDHPPTAWKPIFGSVIRVDTHVDNRNITIREKESNVE